MKALPYRTHIRALYVNLSKIYLTLYSLFAHLTNFFLPFHRRLSGSLEIYSLVPVHGQWIIYTTYLLSLRVTEHSIQQI